MNKIYVVKQNDTLTKIAHAHNTSVEELVSLNHISNIHFIRVGQKLKLPPPVQPLPAKSASEKSVTDEAGLLYIKFLDAIEKPIAKMKAWVKVGAEEFEHTTNAKGHIPPVIVKEPNTKVSVSVGKVNGGKKEVSVFTANSGQDAAVQIIGPKGTVGSQQRRNDGKPPQNKPASNPPKAGTEIKTRSDKGHPLQQLYCQCPNKDNLKLRIKNERFRDTLVAAGKRCSFTPWTAAAIVDAEAAALYGPVLMPVIDKRSGKSIIDKKTNLPKTYIKSEKVGWNENSKNPSTSARGLTQFFDTTWILMATTKNTFLYEKAIENGWLTTATKVVKRKNKSIPAFKLYNGSLVTADTLTRLAQKLSVNPYIIANAKASDKNLQALLDLRFKGEFAIHTALDYANSNIGELENKGYKDKISVLIDGEKAKLAYLCHHLGEGGATNFIQNAIGPEKAKTLLLAQFGLKKKSAYIKATEKESTEAYTKAETAAKKGAMKYLGVTEISNYVQAHRAFIKKYVDSNVIIENHMCDTSTCKKNRSIIDITIAIRL